MGKFRTRMVSCPSRLNPEIAAQLDKIDAYCFPGEPLIEKAGKYWWIIYHKDRPVAFAGLSIVDNGTVGYLCRAGTISKYRGLGFQSHLIRLRQKMVRKLNLHKTITYTHRESITSANNLIKNGFKLYLPNAEWAGLHTKDTLYFCKDI